MIVVLLAGAGQATAGRGGRGASAPRAAAPAKAAPAATSSTPVRGLATKRGTSLAPHHPVAVEGARTKSTSNALTAKPGKTAKH